MELLMRRASDMIWPLLAQLGREELATTMAKANQLLAAHPKPPEPLPFQPAPDSEEDWRCMPWSVIDTETTGLSDDSRIVHLAFVRFELGEVTDMRRMYLNPGCAIGPSATEIHGITNERVKGKPSFRDIVDKLLEALLKAEIIVAYNAPFDLGRIRHECRRAGETFQPRRFLEEDFDYVMRDKPVIDPLVMVRCGRVGRFWKGKGRHKLRNAAEQMGVDIPANLHLAHVDAIVCGQLLWKLTANFWPTDPHEMSAFLANKREEQDYNFQQFLARKQGSASKHHDRRY